MFHVAYASKVKTFNYFHGDVHRHLVFVRFLLFVWGFGLGYNALIHLIPCVLIFPLWHDGVYYVSRSYFVGGRINLARFAFQSKETTAVHSYDFPVRALLFFIGSLIWAVFL